MGKTIIQQARGRGSLTYRVKPKAYRYKILYPKVNTESKAVVIKLLNSSAHSSPLAKIQLDKGSFYNPAAQGIYEGQEIEIGKTIAPGNIVKLKDVPQGTKVFNLETVPGKGGKLLRSGGCSGTVMNRDDKQVEIVIRRKKIKLNKECRATIGVVAGDGRTSKPLVKAGKMYHLMASKGRKWHRTSAVKRNAVDHPFGGGRGKRIKSKIAKRNAPPGKKVGHIRPSRTGRTK